MGFGCCVLGVSLVATIYARHPPDDQFSYGFASPYIPHPRLSTTSRAGFFPGLPSEKTQDTTIPVVGVPTEWKSTWANASLRRGVG